MARFLLAVTVWSSVITPLALSADGPENGTPAPPAPAKLAPIYVKLISPFDPNTVIEMDQPVIESWITKSIEKRHQANSGAVTAWVPLVIDDPLEGTDVWNGAYSGLARSCPVGADITERKDGTIKIEFRGWSPGGAEAKVTLKDEPGTREVIPVPQAETKHGVPHVAIFIGLPAEVRQK